MSQISRLPKKDDPSRVPKPRGQGDQNASPVENDLIAVVAEARAMYGAEYVDDIVDHASLVFDKHGVRGVGHHGERRTYVLACCTRLGSFKLLYASPRW